ncbi:hypothetical protein POVWA2_036990 [Plasmodium ovale wallikeri]|uniref:Uncharacterized protein n=1 Tax=Plasmodium ovale wallikeri TaxID=864142 RepID=A0A1A8Z3M6_PLAOA|nr:hypothetical protein POVWA1_038010 [Plasmodium ovale wallikeri]SBT39073.1 hypothetical protein POVWA2_036990 [Plasmodium ovale wallikeri]
MRLYSLHFTTPQNYNRGATPRGHSLKFGIITSSKIRHCVNYGYRDNFFFFQQVNALNSFLPCSQERSGMPNKNWEIQFSPFRGQRSHMLLNPRGCIQRNVSSHVKNFQAEKPFFAASPR